MAKIDKNCRCGYCGQLGEWICITDNVSQCKRDGKWYVLDEESVKNAEEGKVTGYLEKPDGTLVPYRNLKTRPATVEECTKAGIEVWGKGDMTNGCISYLKQAFITSQVHKHCRTFCDANDLIFLTIAEENFRRQQLAGEGGVEIIATNPTATKNPNSVRVPNNDGRGGK